MEFGELIDRAVFTALRPYQKTALLKINQYVSSDSMKQALIKMPMGTGKSTIIAVTSAFLPAVQSSIVVTATAAVKDQLLKDISEQVWAKMGINERPSKEILEIKPSTFINVPDKHTVFVTTIQALLLLKIKKPDEFELLRNKVDLLIFDEGHKEPANNWQTVIRSLEKKVVLFTATPVRNDVNKFQIDPNYTFSYPFQEARNQRYIREVEFETLQSDTTPDLRTFANKLFTRYEDYVQQEGCNRTDVKVIIRCGNYEDISAIVEVLKDRSTVLGIHEQFRDSGNDLLTHKVPEDIRTSDVIFWVHQYKLIEGIDNHQFCLLGIYESLPDPRSLIQQIGRIIRESNPSRQSIVLLWENELHQRDWWESYLEYERLTSLNPTEILFKYKEYFHRVKEANPLTAYINKKFLKRFAVDDVQEVEDKLKKYQIPKKTNVFEFLESLDDPQSAVDNLLEQITEEFNHIDVLILDRFKVEDKNTGCILYSRYENSSVLVGESFLEIKLEIVFFRVMGNKLYYFDSNQYIPFFIKKDWRRINATQLKKLFSRESQFSSMTVQNGNINFNDFNRMIVNSKDVSRMVPDVTDKFKLCTTLIGSKQGKKGVASLRRYVGFSNARIAQDTNAVPLTSYLSWLEEINNQINAATYQEHDIFERFAPISDIPTKVAPSSILLQFDTDKNLLKTGYGSSTEIDQIFYNITNSKFPLSWDGDIYEVEISFSSKIGKYIMGFTDPTREPNVYVDAKKRTKLLDWLNEEQAFQIIVEGNEYRYFMGNFYKIGVPADYSWLIDILDENELVFPGRIKKMNEKGPAKATVHNVMWHANSLFYLVAQRGSNISNTSTLKTLLSHAEYVVCTDLQTEIADFITISETTSTICFIHCKAGDSKLSASVFQEVCGQVVKNLDYVNPGSNRSPYNLSTWDGDWAHESYKVRLNRKIHNPGNLSAEDIWMKLKSIQKNPESKTYVIALMGDAFSKSKYLSEKGKTLGRQKPEVIQIDYILNQTATAVGRAQANFLVAFNKY